MISANSTTRGIPEKWHPLLPAFLLRTEGVALLVLSTLTFFHLGGSWILFFALILAPDVAMLGYLAGPRLGAMSYNLVHAYPLPAALLAYGFFGAAPLAVLVSLVGFAHIGLDRTLGYGLKSPAGFKETHLGRL